MEFSAENCIILNFVDENTREDLYNIKDLTIFGDFYHNTSVFKTPEHTDCKEMEAGKFIFLRLYVIPMITCLPVTGSGSRACPKLSAREMREMWKKLYEARSEELDLTFYNIPELMKSVEVKTYSAKEKRELGIRTTHLYGPRKCPKQSSHGLVDLEDNCPVRYIMHHDRNRIPQNLVHAQCVCTKCRHGNLGSPMHCQPVYTVTKMLRRNPDVPNMAHLNCTYDWAYEKVPVACTCKSAMRVVEKPIRSERF